MIIGPGSRQANCKGCGKQVREFTALEAVRDAATKGRGWVVVHCTGRIFHVARRARGRSLT